MFEHIVSFQARYRPGATAIHTPVGDASFAQLDADVNRMARRLAPLLAPRARVAVQVAGSGLHWVVLLALARLGCVSASLPPVGERSEGELLERLRCDALLTDREPPATGVPVVRLTPEWVQETFQSPAEPLAPHVFSPNDPVRLVMSSGTTGAPKTVVLTRAMVDARIRTGGLSVMVQRPLHAAVGLDTETGFRAPFVAWATGQPALYPETGFRWAEFLLRSRPKMLVMVPAQLEHLLAGLPAEFPPLPELAVVLISAAPTPSLLARARARLTPDIFVTYGSTEAGLAAQASPVLLAGGEALTGIVSPSAEVQVVDAAHQPLAAGAPGRIRVRTEEMVQGYLDDPELTARFFREGWFYPGDLGALSADGRLVVHGRETEVIELGGARLAPDAVEAVLLACRGVRDAAAFGAPGPGGAPQAHVAVVCDNDCRAETLAAALRQALPQFDIALHLVASIPRSERGKVDRSALQTVLASPAGRA